MTVLAPMRTEAFAAVIEAAVSAYAADNVAVGRWPAAEALSLSRAETERLLPQGLATPGHQIYEIRDETRADFVGFVWFAVMQRGSAKAAYVYQIQVWDEFRRRGHARAALLEVEVMARAQGLSSVGLHVFAHNPKAQALYASLGYELQSLNMLKRLGQGGA